MHEQTILVVDDSRLVNDVVRDVLRAAGFLVVQAFNGEDALGILPQRQIDLIVMDLIMPGMDGFALLGQIRSHPDHANVPVMILTTKADVDEKVAVEVAGADDYVVKPFDPSDLIRRVRALLMKPPGGARPKAAPVESLPTPAAGKPMPTTNSVTGGKIITVYSLKGGVGTSAIATNLAVSLQQLWDEPTVMMDLNLEAGTLNVLLDILPTSSLEDLARQNGNLNPETVSQYLVRHNSGVSLLAAPPSPERAELIGAPTIQQTLRLLKDSFDYVIIDTASNFSEHTLLALEMADAIIMPLIPDMSSIRTSSVSLDVFHALSIPDERIFPVLNEIVPKAGLNRKQVEAALRRPVAYIPYAAGKLVDSINRGTPLVTTDPDHPSSVAMEELAYSVSRPESRARPRTSPSSMLVKVRKRLK